LSVGGLLGLRAGDNPHQWYSPSNVTRVQSAIVADSVRLDPKDGAYLRGRQRAFETTGLARYHALIAQIRGRYGVAQSTSRRWSSHRLSAGRK
jgi:zinc/manganese transport system substrate-binding protein